MSTPKANLSNWLSSPSNRWAFANIDQILTTATVHRSDKPTALPNALKKFDAFNLDHDGTQLSLSSFLQKSHTDGIILLQHGKVLLEDYFHDNTKDSKHIVMSITKSVTDLLVGILQAHGKLSVNDLVSKYVPEMANSIYKDKTIQQCIDMRAGAVYVDGTHEYRAASGWHPLNGTEKHVNLKAFLSDFNPETTDDRFGYVSANTDLIGWVLERASGKTFAELLQELLWKPMGGESDALITLEPSGLARSAGGLAPTLRDLARVAQLFADDGKNVNGDVVVPADWIQDILHDGSKEAWQRGSFAPLFKGYFDDMAYRAYCYVDERTETVFGFGVFGQAIMVDRKRGIVLAATRSQDNALDTDVIRMTLGAFKEFQRLLAQS